MWTGKDGTSTPHNESNAFGKFNHFGAWMNDSRLQQKTSQLLRIERLGTRGQILIILPLELFFLHLHKQLRAFMAFNINLTPASVVISVSQTRVSRMDLDFVITFGRRHSRHAPICVS